MLTNGVEGLGSGLINRSAIFIASEAPCLYTFTGSTERAPSARTFGRRPAIEYSSSVRGLRVLLSVPETQDGCQIYATCSPAPLDPTRGTVFFSMIRAGTPICLSNNARTMPTGPAPT